MQKSAVRRAGNARFLEEPAVFASAGRRLLHFWSVRAMRAESRTSQVVCSLAVAKASCGVLNEAVRKSRAARPPIDCCSDQMIGMRSMHSKRSRPNCRGMSSQFAQACQVGQFAPAQAAGGTRASKSQKSEKIARSVRQSPRNTQLPARQSRKARGLFTFSASGSPPVAPRRKRS
jgi:hypothetical protein